MNQKDCPFCENLKKTKEEWTYFKETSPRRSIQEARKEYKVALIEETYEENVDYRTGLVTHQFMSLNFCPVCGRKIEKD